MAGDEEATAPPTVRAAAAVLAIEAAGLAALGVVVLVKVVRGAPSSVVFAVVAAVLVLATAAAVLALARAVRRCRGWAFVPVIVLQGLALPVGYSLAVQGRQWLTGGPVLVLALAELCLLVAPSSRRALGPGAHQ